MKHLNLTIPKPCASFYTHPGFTLLKAGLACFILLFSSSVTFSQTASVNGKTEITKRHESYPARASDSHIVRGIVKDEAGNPMPGVNIYLLGGREGTVTDAEGRFEFPRGLEAGDRLTISFIGYESVEYVVQNNADEFVTITMDLDVIVIGEVAVEKVYTTESGFRQWLKNIF